MWDYARAGGTVVVQYHKPREDGPGRFVPFDGVSLPRPAPRVSQATAPVSLLTPDDPILSFPNRLSTEDFVGWQQERGLYFLAAWPREMTPLLESADPGEEPRRGGCCAPVWVSATMSIAPTRCFANYPPAFLAPTACWPTSSACRAHPVPEAPARYHRTGLSHPRPFVPDKGAKNRRGIRRRLSPFPSYSSVTHPSEASFTVLMYLYSVPRVAL